MKLNPDCVRDCLIYLEDNLTYMQPNGNECKIIHKTLSIFDVANNVRDEYFHDYNDVLYALEMLIDAEFITYNSIRTDSKKNILICDINNITFQGQEFLNTIRSESIWETTKKGAAKIGLCSIRALSSIAMNVMNAVITNPAVISKIVECIK